MLSVISITQWKPLITGSIYPVDPCVIRTSRVTCFIHEGGGYCLIVLKKKSKFEFIFVVMLIFNTLAK